MPSLNLLHDGGFDLRPPAVAAGRPASKMTHVRDGSCHSRFRLNPGDPGARRRARRRPPRREWCRPRPDRRTTSPHAPASERGCSPPADRPGRGADAETSSSSLENFELRDPVWCATHREAARRDIAYTRNSWYAANPTGSGIAKVSAPLMAAAASSRRSRLERFSRYLSLPRLQTVRHCKEEVGLTTEARIHGTCRVARIAAISWTEVAPNRSRGTTSTAASRMRSRVTPRRPLRRTHEGLCGPEAMCARPSRLVLDNGVIMTGVIDGVDPYGRRLGWSQEETGVRSMVVPRGVG